MLTENEAILTARNLQQIAAAAIGEQARLAALCEIKDERIKQLEKEIEQLKKDKEGSDKHE